MKATDQNKDLSISRERFLAILTKTANEDTTAFCRNRIELSKLVPFCWSSNQICFDY